MVEKDIPAVDHLHKDVRLFNHSPELLPDFDVFLIRSQMDLVVFFLELGQLSPPFEETLVFHKPELIDRSLFVPLRPPRDLKVNHQQVLLVILDVSVSLSPSLPYRSHVDDDLHV